MKSKRKTIRRRTEGRKVVKRKKAEAEKYKKQQKQ